jgi:hypothetical protein
VARAKEFYGSTFGWDLQDYDMDGGSYTILMTVPVDDRQLPTEPGAINGGLMKRSADTPHPVITIQVDEIDDALKSSRPAERPSSRAPRSPRWGRSRTSRTPRAT